MPSCKWPGERSRLGRDSFHQIAVADECVGVVIDDRVPGAVVASGELRFGDRHTDRIGEALAKGPRGHFDPGRVAALRMSRRLTAPLAKLLDIIERELIARHVQQAVEQRRAMTCREHEAVAIEPQRIAADCA